MSEQIQAQRSRKPKEAEEPTLDPLHEKVREEARKKIKSIIARVSCIEVKPEGDNNG